MLADTMGYTEGLAIRRADLNLILDGKAQHNTLVRQRQKQLLTIMALCSAHYFIMLQQIWPCLKT